jgi:fluoroacetyl-CoA thioesterase
VRPSLACGLEGAYRYRIPEAKTVPHIYEEAPDFQLMPAVLATGYLVALVEWACIELVKPHLDWPAEQTLGTHVDLSHMAPTLPGMTVEVRVRLESIEGRRLAFTVHANDGVDTICEGRHERHAIALERFAARLERKAALAGAAG